VRTASGSPSRNLLLTPCPTTARTLPTGVAPSAPSHVDDEASFLCEQGRPVDSGGCTPAGAHIDTGAQRRARTV
jgi:hypothetical protein